ncbi:hypothetical protein GGI07_000023 [Coemansia sp. Benny D115]|nr:hypothetical protein GGI07_000023 [Coemansia sp. Benny D115]
MLGRTDASAAADRSGCGLGESLSSGFPSTGGLSLGHSDLLSPRKRSLDNVENIPPPFGYDGSGAPPAGVCGDSKPSLSLLDMTAQQQLSNTQRKQRRMAITASSPGSQQRLSANPRRASHYSDTSFMRSTHRRSQGQPEGQGTVKASRTSSAISSRPVLREQLPQSQQQLQQRVVNVRGQLPQQQPKQLQPPAQQKGMAAHPAHTLRQTIGSSSASSANNGARLRRLPKRNLKPLDFSGIRRSSSLQASGHSATALQQSAGNATASSTAEKPASDVPTAHGKPAGAHSAQHASAGHAAVASVSIVSLPVSPAQSSPVSTAPLEPLSLPASSPALAPVKSEGAAPADASGTAHPTPPNTGPRRQSAFSGLLASAYQRASAKRSSKRALFFGGSSSFDDDEALQACDPVLGPRCPVIGDPRGLFEDQRSGIDSLQREQSVRSETKFTEMKRTVYQAQAAFEAAVSQQRPRGRPPGKKTARASSANSAAPAAAPASGSKRPVSVCKYCGKQYKYHSKLASHEQHCASRLEALLYSADENEQHIIHCTCGPRHDRPVGARDDLPMVQCDNCLLWLHIECVGIDEENLPEEFFCPRCDGTACDDRAFPSTPKRRSNHGSDAGGILSPESTRLATLLENVPNDGSDTEDEPMDLKVKTRLHQRLRGGLPSSEDTMSISDAAEVARFHRQGSSAKRCNSPIAPRMAQSEANMSPVATPLRRRHVRKGAKGAQQTVHTDVLSSDFLGLPLPESIFSAKPGLGHHSQFSIPPGLCSQQASMDDLSQFLNEPQPQWSLAQLSDMLGGGGDDQVGGNASIGMMGAGSSFLNQALADLGLGFGAPVPGGSLAGEGATEAPLSELVDLPADNEFSVLLDSIASGSPGVDSSFGGLMNDDIMLELQSSMPLSAPISAAVAAPSGSRMFASRLGVSMAEHEHGSSSTITLMHDNSSLLSSCDDVSAAAGGATAARNLPLPARPPPGMPGMACGRVPSAGPKRGVRAGLAQPPQSQQLAAHGLGGLSSDGLLGASGQMASAGFLAQPGASDLVASLAAGMATAAPAGDGLSAFEVEQLLATAGSGPLLDWQADGDVLDGELEGLINFDA